MINFTDRTNQLAALNQPINEELKQLIRQSTALAYANGLADLTHILVIEPGDTEADIIEAVGFIPLASRIGGIRNEPDWDVFQEHSAWWQLTYCVGNSGFAFILFVSKAAGTLPELQAMCRRSVEP